jgi:hypothetical protein
MGDIVSARMTEKTACELGSKKHNEILLTKQTRWYTTTADEKKKR